MELGCIIIYWLKSTDYHYYIYSNVVSEISIDELVHADSVHLLVIGSGTAKTSPKPKPSHQVGVKTDKNKVQGIKTSN